MTHSSQNSKASSLDRKMLTRELNIKEIKEADVEHTEKEDSEHNYKITGEERQTSYYIGDGKNQNVLDYEPNEYEDEYGLDEKLENTFEPTFKSPNSFTKTLDDERQHRFAYSNELVVKKSRRHIFDERSHDAQSRVDTKRNFHSPEKLEGTSDFVKRGELSKELFKGKYLPYHFYNVNKFSE